VVARWQLLRLGLTEAAVDTRVWTGRLYRVHQGVYAVGHPYVHRNGRLMAAALAFGPRAVLSHRTAAELWGILRPTSTRPHVTSAHRSFHGKPGIVLHRCRSLAPELRTEVDGLPVTTVERVLLDLAGEKDTRALRRAWEGAQREGLLDVRRVVELVENSPGRRVKPLRALIEEATDAPNTRSEFEDRFTDFLRKYGLPRALRNILIGGYLVDAYFPGTGLIVELDGEHWHWNRREQDSERDADLHIAGYTVYRVTWNALTRHPDRTAAKIRRLLATAPAPRVAISAGP
jgi:very-short-patch-repair endonuclease